MWTFVFSDTLANFFVAFSGVMGRFRSLLEKTGSVSWSVNN